MHTLLWRREAGGTPISSSRHSSLSTLVTTRAKRDPDSGIIRAYDERRETAVLSPNAMRAVGLARSG